MKRAEFVSHRMSCTTVQDFVDMVSLFWMCKRQMKIKWWYMG